MNCPICGSSIDPEWNICPQCSTPTTKQSPKSEIARPFGTLQSYDVSDQAKSPLLWARIVLTPVIIIALLVVAYFEYPSFRRFMLSRTLSLIFAEDAAMTDEIGNYEKRNSVPDYQYLVKRCDEYRQRRNELIERVQELDPYKYKEVIDNYIAYLNAENDYLKAKCSYFHRLNGLELAKQAEAEDRQRPNNKKYLEVAAQRIKDAERELENARVKLAAAALAANQVRNAFAQVSNGLIDIPAESPFNVPTEAPFSTPDLQKADTPNREST